MWLKEQVGFFVLSHFGHTQCELHHRLRRAVATEMPATGMDFLHGVVSARLCPEAQPQHDQSNLDSRFHTKPPILSS